MRFWDWDDYDTTPRIITAVQEFSFRDRGSLTWCSRPGTLILRISRGKAPPESRFGVIWDFDITGRGKISGSTGVFGFRNLPKRVHT